MTKHRSSGVAPKSFHQHDDGVIAQTKNSNSEYNLAGDLKSNKDSEFPLARGHT